MADIKAWSSTAANNNDAPPDGFPENMAPSNVNNAARETMAAVRRWYEDAEWRDFGDTATYASGTSFTLNTDLTDRYVVNRRIRAVGSTTGTIYGTITASEYSDPNTTVTVAWDSGSLSSETLAVSLGVDPTNASIPGGALSGITERRIYDEAGEYSLTVPSHINYITVTIVGGGGGGGEDSGSAAGSGGGGATVNRMLLDVQSDRSVDVTVGAGGLGATSVGGTSGGASSVAANGVTITAGGGGGGGSALGGNGGTTTVSSPFGISGTAGGSNGGAAGRAAVFASATGAPPGTGGTNTGLPVGEDGQDGLVIIEW